MKKSHDDKNEEGDEAASGELNSSDVNEFVGVQVVILPAESSFLLSSVNVK